MKNYKRMNRERDKKLIQVFLDCYNTLGGTDYRVDSYPDEETRYSKSVDALCGAGVVVGSVAGWVAG